MTHKITFEVDRETAETFAAILSETAEDAAVSITEVVPDAPGTLWRVDAYIQGGEGAAQDLAAFLCGAVDGSGTAPVFTIEPLPETDWVTLTQQGLPPVHAGGFIIHGSHDRHRAGTRRLAIEIEAGRAFGTAHHGTTQGCLTLLARIARHMRLESALDVGTGSGVLAIAAARLGARVLATDIDPVAVAVARENIRINRSAARVRAVTARGLMHPAVMQRAPFDLIMANILAKPLLLLEEDLRHALRPGGVLILSGLLDTQAAEVFGRYRSAGFRLVRRLSLDGWAAIALMRT